MTKDDLISRAEVEAMVEQRRDCAKEDMRELQVHFEDAGRRLGLGRYNALASMVQEQESILRAIRAIPAQGGEGERLLAAAVDWYDSIPVADRRGPDPRSELRELIDAVGDYIRATPKKEDRNERRELS
jgi:hypothetical protein